MTTDAEARLIAIDWGTSSCRAYLLGSSGAILAQREEASGTMAVSARAANEAISRAVAFERAFDDLCEDWLRIEPALPVIACGMVGSNHGWAEADYRNTPAEMADTGIRLTTVRTRTGRNVHIVPGLITGGTLPSVMRGEETQILGALAASGDGIPAHRAPGRGASQIVLLPGTHSKWVRVVGTVVSDFTTYMTGEVFALLSNESTLSRLALKTVRSSWDAFDRGVEVAASPAGAGGFLGTAFSARSLALTGELAREDILDYLSGLLIGDEIAGIGRTWLLDGERSVILCGADELNSRYRRALQRFGITVSREAQQSAAAGMWLTANAAGLLSERAAVVPSAMASGPEPEPKSEADAKSEAETEAESDTKPSATEPQTPNPAPHTERPSHDLPR
ncbi:2-dehydro-3-deoxygalactonokinase [Paenarthrobacter sp. Z7-10]|uniref:2-dehydro-3-deoxygalactonokinase n=1 Tax=Paenarthrobacter sp. Z7-10 TaxID=2787635 RepID=UPI0022A981FF|nr:2-dehydro-3-deoxygalactonokinase [Paenarthrobacter sp. Z7-10]